MTTRTFAASRLWAACLFVACSSAPPPHLGVPPPTALPPAPLIEAPLSAPVASTVPIAAPPPELPAKVFEALRAAPRARQTATPAVIDAQPIALKRRWQTSVGRTTFRTTMALHDGLVVIGTHGTTLDKADEKTDGIYLLEAATGKVKTLIATPGAGDRDIGGIALDGPRIFFTSDNGLVGAFDDAGKLIWKQKLGGKVRPAPALGDLDGDGDLDVVAGDETGALAAFDADSGKKLWSHTAGPNDYGSKGYVGAPAIADIDADGAFEVIAGSRGGALEALSGKDGTVRWQLAHDSGIHAAPLIADLDGDGRREVLAAWSYGDLEIADLASGHELWGTRLELDSAGIEGLFASPVPVPGKPGVIVQGTAWWGKDDGVVGVGPLARAYKSYEDRMSATPVVVDLDGDGNAEAIVGTEKGALLAFGTARQRTVLAKLGGPIEAPALLADSDGDGTLELFVASNDGMLSCFETGVTATPVLARFRGDRDEAAAAKAGRVAFHNRGEIDGAVLGWSVPRGTSLPSAHPASGGAQVHIDYLRCCQALADAATRVSVQSQKLLLEASAQCLQLAARGVEREEAMKQLGGAVNASDACR